jgi:hypothetical protein
MPAMSDDRSRAAPPRGAYGPGKTVLAQPAFLDDAAAGGSAYGAPPPTTVRDPSVDDLNAHRPFGVPPLPAQTRSRRRGGPSLFLIGAVSTVVIGGAATFIAIQAQATSDDKPAASANVPTSTAVTAEPPSPPTPPDDPSLADTRPAPPPRRADPSRLRGGRPGGTARPGGSGSAPPPRLPPPRRAW